MKIGFSNVMQNLGKFGKLKGRLLAHLLCLGFIFVTSQTQSDSCPGRLQNAISPNMSRMDISFKITILIMDKIIDGIILVMFQTL